MPASWQHRPTRYNASLSRYCKDEVTVIHVRPKSGPPVLVLTSPWGPDVVRIEFDETLDLEIYRASYLELHPKPVPIPGPVMGPSVYELLRRPEL